VDIGGCHNPSRLAIIPSRQNSISHFSFQSRIPRLLPAQLKNHCEQKEIARKQIAAKLLAQSSLERDAGIAGIINRRLKIEVREQGFPVGSLLWHST